MGITTTSQAADVIAEINITPFTDVLLVLLIIFMILAAIAAPPGFQKSLQKAGTVPPPPPFTRSIRIEIGAASQVYVDGLPAAPSQIYASVARAVQRHGSDPAHFSKHIELIGSTSASYSTIITVLDAGRQAGDDDVGLVIE